MKKTLLRMRDWSTQNWKIQRDHCAYLTDPSNKILLEFVFDFGSWNINFSDRTFYDFIIHEYMNNNAV